MTHKLSDVSLEDTDPIDKLRDALKARNLEDIDTIDVNFLSSEYRDLLEKDAQLLKSIQKRWFSDDTYKDVDPKLEKFVNHLKNKLQSDDGKVIVFSEFADTVYYITDELKKDPELKGKVISYSGKDGGDALKKVIAQNFDAGLSEDDQKDDYQILIATDAISEGYNLHRADCVYNYDIPYNPTRVIQRIGRINRVNKKVFPELYIYNFFPSEIGEAETHTKSISTIKVHIFNALLGDDTKKLTSDEELRSYYSDKFNEARTEEESENSLTRHINKWNAIKHNDSLLEKVEIDAVNKSKVARKSPNSNVGVILYGKRGDTSVFCLKDKEEAETKYINTELALDLFEADPDTPGSKVSQDYQRQFEYVRDHLYKNNTNVATPDKGRQEAIAKLKVLAEKLESNLQQNYCYDLIESIHDFDALAESELKIIRNVLIGEEPVKAYVELSQAIPIEYIANIHRAADSARNETSMLILTEELN